MIVERKLDGAADKYSPDQEKFLNPTQLYITCEKYGGLHLVELGLMAELKIWVRLEILKACCRSKYSIFGLV